MGKYGFYAVVVVCITAMLIMMYLTTAGYV